VSVGEAQQAIWDIVKKIPSGRVASYGRVAYFAGYPRHARMVGRALREAPDHLSLPWHRVVNAKGKISFPAGSERAILQKGKLQSEGVTILSGRIDLERYAWLGPLDSELWQM